MTEVRPFFARRLSRTQLVGLDVLVAVVLTMAILPATDRPVLGVLLALPLAVRRVWPRTVFWLVLAVAVAAVAMGSVGYAYLAPAYALYTVASTGGENRWASTVTVSAVGVGLLAFLAVAGAVPEGSRARTAVDIMFGLAALAGAWSVGRAVHERRTYAARDAARAAEQAVADERLRIARELHDVVTHSMGLIAVKAGVANHVLDRRPEQAREALAVIETTSRGSLNEMRLLLGVLRAEPSLRPMPGISGLGELVERNGGVLELDVEGEVPEGAGLACYRIVQEALTNAAKHARGAACRVVVADQGGVLRIEVTDEGRPAKQRAATSHVAGIVRHAATGNGTSATRPAATGNGTSATRPAATEKRASATRQPAVAEGHGLIGMRERVAMYGGAFEAGPRPGGGFRVMATLPYLQQEARP
ncbi:sensor histidine kinase [Nonomuraea sp. NPDC050663]|uniref:sensor histidine kinase n=1 Tax=Nonomuraea sp. NPDC050663 TaxID=3364370 RepID=UPI003791883D